MALPRTKTLGIQDLVMARVFPSATAVDAVRMVCPIAGYIERVLFVRGGVHSATEDMLLIMPGGNTTFTLATGGALRDTDIFECSKSPEFLVDAAGLIHMQSTGSPSQTTPIGVFFVIKRQ